jgi:hypothetical protein
MPSSDPDETIEFFTRRRFSTLQRQFKSTLQRQFKSTLRRQFSALQR